MIADAGYSTTPLTRKLGLRAGQAVGFISLPVELDSLTRAEDFASMTCAGAADALEAPEGGFDLVHAFFVSADEMSAALAPLRAAIRPAGMIWISWPKKASKVSTNITEDVIRAAALCGGLVDVKVCAVTDVWSGLKLVIPVPLRPDSRQGTAHG